MIKKKNDEFLSTNHSLMLKGVGILLVLINHIGLSFHTRVFTPLGGIGVAIFLILSGYGLSESVKKHGLVKFFTRRFKKVLVPYFIVTLFWYFVSINNNLLKPGTILKYLMLINVPNMMWYVRVIIILYTVFYLINRFEIFKQNKYILYLLVSIIMIMDTNTVVAEQAFSFFTGVMLSDNKRGKMNKGNSKYVYVLLLLAVFFLAFKQINFIRNGNYLILNLVQLIIKLPAALFIIYYSLKFTKYRFNKIFSMLGIIAYEIYLIHPKLLFLLDSNNIQYLFLFLLLTLVASFCLQWTLNKVYYLIEENKSA